MAESTGVKIPASRIVVVMPNWLGDGVMATPFLRALRGLYPEAHIAAVARPLVGPVCEGLVDEVKICGKKEERGVARWMRGEQFELGVLLPNSFRSAWMMWRGGVKRRLGYARGGRSLLLTDRVAAMRKTTAQVRQDDVIRAAIELLRFEEGVADGELVRVEVEGRYSRMLGLPVRRRRRVVVERRMMSTGQVVRSDVTAILAHRDGVEEALLADFQPVPTIDYYLELARYLGAEGASRQMEQHASEAETREAEGALAALGISNLKSQISDFKSQISDFVVLVPGANFGASKCWLPERFAQVAERLSDPAGRFGMQVILAGSPAEMPICEAILGAIKSNGDRVHVLGKLNGGKGVSIGALKEIVRRSRMMICNDTGPRHIAAAFGVPTVTLFGPTDPVWAETFSEKERIVRVPVPCGPCQLKACPIDHRCMKGITVEMVMEAVAALWNAK